MYKFHYDYDLKTFNNVKLLFTDTDSLVYGIRGCNVYEQCFKDKHLFDFRGYNNNSIYFFIKMNSMELRLMNLLD